MNFVDAKKANKCFKVAMSLACYVGEPSYNRQKLIAINLHQSQLLYLYFSYLSALRVGRSSQRVVKGIFVTRDPFFP